eukprot:TRINITY_DN9598_c0_g3_i5.p1 TRINITY_DN9598_c0_g3~~TRINITY_DN9598_c0_g3_i5.p1  ORF type:complete len:223 (+),score=25.01 TRINITY_DN9598_c0_g3_i5:76-744(+)
MCIRDSNKCAMLVLAQKLFNFEMNSIAELPHARPYELDNKVAVGISEDILAGVLPDFGLNVAASTERLKAIYWKLWLRCLTQIRLPSASPEANCCFYLQASRRANRILGRYVSAAGDRIDCWCSAETIESTVIARELIEEVIASSLNRYKSVCEQPIQKAKRVIYKTEGKVKKKPFTVANSKVRQERKAIVPVKRKNNFTEAKKSKFGRNGSKSSARVRSGA